MAQFATAADLAARLGVDLSADEQTRADTLLALSSGLVQREARQRIELVEDDVLTRPGASNGRFRLPERPVVSVSAVTLNGAAVNAGSDGYVLVDDTLVYWRGWGCGDEAVSVTYTHGFAEIPDAIKAVTLEPVVRVWVNPGNVMHERYGAEMTYYAMQAVPAGLLLNAEEQRVIRDVLRRTASSVALR